MFRVGTDAARDPENPLSSGITFIQIVAAFSASATHGDVTVGCTPTKIISQPRFWQPKSFDMGKKRTPIFRSSSASNTNSRDNDKIKAIRTWGDVEHDSEDEFHEEREKVLLEDDQNYNLEDGQSEEEVYGLEGLDSEEESDDSMAGEQEEEEEPEDKTWGRSKKAYYNADEGDDLDELREEEEEALKIQKERLAAMNEADFVDDTLQGWGQTGEQDEEADKKLVESVNKDLDDISFERRKNLPVSEKLKILQNESPELMDLLNEFKEKSQAIASMDTTLQTIREQGKDQQREAKFISFKYQLLMNYLTNISFYLALKASGTANIREHPVIHALVELRTTLEKMEQVEEKLQPTIDQFIQTLHESGESELNAVAAKKQRVSKKKVKVQAPVELEEEEEEEELSDEDDEQEIIDQVNDIEEEFKSLKKLAKKRKRALADDFGDLELLDEVDMEDKIAKKRSIRDYVAKIDAKQSKARSKYQGDSDLPYRDRNKQEKKGVPQPKDTSADLDDADWDEEDNRVADEMANGAGDEDDDYYEQIASEKAAKKASKKEEYEAERMPNVDVDYKLEDGEKRLASYQILKNRGLTPHRKKENRNARVKHRNKFAKKMKNLSSTRAVVKPLAGTYAGEATGIKSNIVKSVKF
ncbi:hypothetical protein DFQ28_002909 [Apophysomyces sp. BC1034]|nr:hypothetical protein DFQ28_002909 [Apophysomyces sp. BC1034]